MDPAHSSSGPDIAGSTLPAPRTAHLAQQSCDEGALAASNVPANPQDLPLQRNRKETVVPLFLQGLGTKVPPPHRAGGDHGWLQVVAVQPQTQPDSAGRMQGPEC